MLMNWTYLRLGFILNNNDIFRLLLSTFNLNEKATIKVFSLAGVATSQEQIAAWLDEGDKTCIKLTDKELAVFLNGFINFKRGKRDGEQAKPENHLNNNMIFQKLRIALSLKTEDILNILELADFHLSKHELSALFRKPANKHYKKCRDETLQLFLQGIQLQTQYGA